MSDAAVPPSRRGERRSVAIPDTGILRLLSPPSASFLPDPFEILTPRGRKVPHVDIGPGRRVLLRGAKGTLAALLFSDKNKLTLVCRRGTSFYGLGGPAGDIEHGGATWTLWNTDAYGYVRGTDPLYVSIPFVIALDRSGDAFGVFLRNTHRTKLAFAEDGGSVIIEPSGGALDLFVIDGPDPKVVLDRYTVLTGKPPAPPLWSLGYHQCRYSYFPDLRVIEVARTLRKRKIPCDAVWLDIDHMDGCRVFTFDRRQFPDPRGLCETLRRQGFRVVTIVDPGVKAEPGYLVYEEGIRASAFVRGKEDGPFIGKVWPGECVFPDFVNRRTREFWIAQNRRILEIGVAGIWNDMNEPAVFRDGLKPPERTFDLEAVHEDDDGALHRHEEVHNVYGMAMTRATREALLRHRPDERPFVLTRATFAGGQRYAAVWTGDNTSSFASMALSIPMLLNLSVSGFAQVGCDAGGFKGDATPELFARWMELAAFLPFMRCHSEKGTKDHEPWSFGGRVFRIARRYIRLRYRLLPFFASLFEEAEATGVPVMRPLWLEFPSEPSLRREETQFLLGPSILVCPVLERGAREREVILPPGPWVDFWDGRVYRGPGRIRVKAPLARLPLFVRGNHVIPMTARMDHVPDGPLDDLRFVVFGARDGGGSECVVRGVPGIATDDPLRASVTESYDSLALAIEGRHALGRATAERLTFASRGADLVPVPRRTLWLARLRRTIDPDLGVLWTPLPSSGRVALPFVAAPA